MIILGLDLGQAVDPAAAALVHRIDADPAAYGPKMPFYPKRNFCTDLREWPLGTDYVDIAASALDSPADVIVVDFGGVGRPVVDIMRRRAMQKRFAGKIVPVQTVGSAARTKLKREARGGHFNVPKIDIVTSITIAQQSGLLQLPDTRETKKLLEQLRIFQMRYSKRSVQFGNASGGHDDLVSALGLALWYSQRFAVSEPAIFMPVASLREPKRMWSPWRGRI